MRRFVGLFLVLVAACGGSPARQAAPAAMETSGEEEESVQLGATSDAEPMMVGWQVELDELEGSLDAELSSFSSTVSAGRCDDASDLTERICELADRICGIAEEHPEASPRCDDAEERCHRSRERFADECG